MVPLFSISYPYFSAVDMTISLTSLAAIKDSPLMTSYASVHCPQLFGTEFTCTELKSLYNVTHTDTYNLVCCCTYAF